jgi:probable rRNA maturation factor
MMAHADRVVVRALRAVGSGASVVLSSDRVVRGLNAAHRGQDKPTNVLTFEPAFPGMAGEIILASGVVRREALAAGRRPAHHLAHLIVHGALHLCGHDHARAGDARRMEMAETRALARIGVPSPWRTR